MKKQVLILLFFLAVCFYLPAQVVKVRPLRPAPGVKGLAPGYGYVWVEGEWRYSPPLNRYMWMPEHWQRPPFVGQVRIPGHWQKVAGGYMWISGRWIKESTITKKKK